MLQTIDRFHPVATDTDTLEYDNDKMLAWMMHEIRNPVTLIHCSLQFIETSNPSLKSDRHWLQLNQDMSSLLLLLKDYSTFSHCQILNRSHVDLFKLISDILGSFEIMAWEKNVTLSIENIHSLPCTLNYSCDAVKIKEVFVNIIKNALEAVSEGDSITISFQPPQLYPEKGNLSYLAIHVKNNGPAIQPAVLERLMEPFVTTKKGGTGIGLFIAKKVLEAHKGFLEVSSDQQETCFSICLPVTTTN